MVLAIDSSVVAHWQVGLAGNLLASSLGSPQMPYGQGKPMSVLPLPLWGLTMKGYAPGGWS